MTKLKWARWALAAAGLALCLNGAALAGLEGLDAPVELLFDNYAVPTVVAQTEHDALFMQGYMHARDRLFQMDFQRRVFAGRLAEMFGPSVIAQDVQLRTLGLARAAERSLAVQTPEMMVWLQAYSDGVNALLADTSIPLPPEYAGLELDRAGIPPWTPLDCLITGKGLAFNLSFDLEDIDRTYALLTFRAVGDILGFNGLHLFNGDLYRTAPFDPTVSIPAPLAPDTTPDKRAPQSASGEGQSETAWYMSHPAFKTLLQEYREKAAEVPLLRKALEQNFSERGSNWWIVAGSLTDSGYPMIANDPHLALDTPATFYEIHLMVQGGMNVTGTSFPGAPGVVLGCNETICWGATVNGLDVTDVYQEVLVATNPAQPTSPTHTFFGGGLEALQFIPQSYLANNIGDGVNNTLFPVPLPPAQSVTMVVPRRNNGPIVGVAYDPAATPPLIGLSVQYVGWGATQEFECFRRFAHAQNMQDFKDALQFFDFGSQNWSYADINGNIAYYTSGELPIREDLQFGFFPDGLQPPYLIRDGSHTLKHEWLPVLNPQPHQSLGNEILPFAEMPQVENPPSGYVLNANNDPIGTSLDNVSWNQFRAGGNGVLYLSPGYATGFRIGRMKRMWDQAMALGPIGLFQLISMQANNQLLDAEVLTPFLLTAFANATDPGAPPELAALGADPGVAEAIARLGAWDFSTPTGITEGLDPFDNPLDLQPPPQEQIDRSVAAAIYSVWRGQVVQRVIDGTLASLPVPLDSYAPGSDLAMSALRKLLDDYPVNGGTGASLINFFNVPGVADQFVARDLILLGTLRSALDLMASDEFAPAFGNSTDQNDYRWGMLHRIVLEHVLGGFLSIPPEGGPPGTGNLGPDLPGIARAGGMGAVDASAHSARADGLNEFMFGHGPARRLVAVMTPAGPQALEVIPGGESGDPVSPHKFDQLFLWMVNAYHPLPVSLEESIALAVSAEAYAPPACGDGEIDAGEGCDDGNLMPGDGCDPFCQEEPLLVNLESFTAELTPRGVLLKWTTTFEIDHVGFRVLRKLTTGRDKGIEILDPQYIPARGSEVSGADYEFLDSSKLGRGTAVYYLEDIDTKGNVTRHGPVSVDLGQGSRQRKADRRQR